MTVTRMIVLLDDDATILAARMEAGLRRTRKRRSIPARDSGGLAVCYKPRRAHAPIFDIAFQQVVSIMKILAAALLSLSFLAASAVAGADASADVSPDTNLDEAELVATLEGGHWRSGDAKGTYRVILRTWASSTSAAASGSSGWPMPGPAAPSQASRRASARVPYAEISNGFWSCGPKRNGLSGVTLTIPAKHAYSGEARKFQAVLGAPGEYRHRGAGG